MPSVFEINSIGSAIAFLAWTLVVIALTKALFGSFLAAELTWQLHQRSAKRHEQIGRLQWEVQHGARFDPDVAHGSPHAARQSLTTAERESRRVELQTLARETLLTRAGRYFASCFACQSFWTALIVCALSGQGDPAGLLFSAAAYSAAAMVMMIMTHRATFATSGDPASSKIGCKHCGR